MNWLHGLYAVAFVLSLVVTATAVFIALWFFTSDRPSPWLKLGLLILAVFIFGSLL